MTAAEARALTNARQGETHLDYLMRTVVYAKIEHEASWGRSETVVSIPRFALGDWRYWEDRTWSRAVDSVVQALRAQGYQAEVEPTPVGSDRIDAEVRVKW